MWHFWIDVGGTFTDCLAVSPEGTEHFTKVLSSGKTKGRIGAWLREDTFRDLEQAGPCDGFWNGATIEFLSHDGRVLAGTTIVEYDDQTGEFVLAEPIRGRVRSGSRYELSSELLAPVLAIHQIQKIPVNQVPLRSHVDLGTTQGTNALLTRNGAKTALVATRGFRDFLRIGDQARPKLFELAIHKLEPLFEVAIEIDERVLANGTVERQPDDGVVRRQLMSLKRQGIESLAICFMFGYRFPEHERRVASIGKDLGFRSVRTSFETAPVVKIVPRGETTVLDAYLNPVISDYFDEIQNQLSADSPVRFMTSGGGLAGCSRFSGKDSVLSGPAGGVVGAARIGEQAGFGRIIGFDMGGTSTDVSRYEGVFERTFETRKAGVRIATPMLAVETVAAGGGSVCWFDGTGCKSVHKARVPIRTRLLRPRWTVGRHRYQLVSRTNPAGMVSL
jgi:5-oxoprolinase (ATP-hydrolysing)